MTKELSELIARGNKLLPPDGEKLFTAADVEAAIRKEREACAMIADYSGAIQHPADGSYNGHQPVMGPDVADAIRSRTTQEGET